MDLKLKDMKRSVARCQLGTALDLFLADNDPVSVHVLASGACELLDGLAEVEGADRFSMHILATFPDYGIDKLRRVQRKYYNAFKHLFELRNATARNDLDALEEFNDEVNDHALFIGWHDYMNLAQSLPVEAQVFQGWYSRCIRRRRLMALIWIHFSENSPASRRYDVQTRKKSFWSE